MMANWIKKLLKQDNKRIPASLRHEYNKTRPETADKRYLCSVPFSMMYFGFVGKAIGCCYTRDFYTGSYPQQRIRDIWNGPEMEAFRKRMRRHDLSKGCHVCREQLMSKNYDGVKARFYDYHKANENGYPVTLEFELSNRCNLECLMCIGLFSSKVRKDREKKAPIPEAYDDNFVRELEEFIPHIKEAKFYGGEPFLIPIYYKIWDKILEINPEATVLVQTNGTVLNDKVKDYMERGRFSINISIDSLNKQRFEMIRKGADFDQVMANLEWFIHYCKRKGTDLGFSITPIVENRMDLAGLVRYCNKREIVLYFNTVVLPHEHAIWQMPQTELAELATELEAEKMEAGNEVAEKNIHHYKDYITQIKAWAETDDKEKAAFLEKILAIRKEYMEQFLGLEA